MCIRDSRSTGVAAQRLLAGVEFVDAQRAFLDDFCIGVQRARLVWACPYAILATEAAVCVDEHHALIGFECRLCGAHVYTARVFTVHAPVGEVEQLERIGPLSYGAHSVYTRAENAQIYIAVSYTHLAGRRSTTRI